MHRPEAFGKNLRRPSSMKGSFVRPGNHRNPRFVLNLCDHDMMTIVLKRTAMKKMAAGAFKAKCLAIMDEVRAKHETVLITKRGKAVAKLVPVNEDTDDIYNFLEGKGSIAGDVVSPALPEDEWGELR